MNTPDCLFCKIVAGEIPSRKVYEDATTVAFLDINPVNPGHTLVIPKVHYENVFEAPADTWMAITNTVKKVSHAVRDGLPVSDLNIIMNNGKHSGQVVFHAHVHIIPRHEGDGFGTWPGTPYKDGEADSIATKIKTSF